MSLSTRLAAMEARHKKTGDGRCKKCRGRDGVIIYRKEDGVPKDEPGFEGGIDKLYPCPGCGWKPMQIAVVYLPAKGSIRNYES